MSAQALRDEVAPSVSKGLTFSDEENADADSRVPKSGRVEAIHNIAEARMTEGIRVPKPQFVAKPNGAVISDETGRVMQDVDQAFNPETRRAIQSGHMCLRCQEPQPSPFPAMCDLCGYPMKERQIIDFALESEGQWHVGPSKPIQAYLDEKDLAREKAAFDRKIQEGHSRGRGARGT